MVKTTRLSTNQVKRKGKKKKRERDYISGLITVPVVLSLLEDNQNPFSFRGIMREIKFSGFLWKHVVRHWDNMLISRVLKNLFFFPFHMLLAFFSQLFVYNRTLAWKLYGREIWRWVLQHTGEKKLAAGIVWLLS